MAKSRGRKFAELIAPSNGVFAAASLPTIALSKLASSTFSVNSESASLGGNVVLDSNDITEHTSALYFTNARADTRADARIAAHNLLARAGGTMTGNLTLGDNVNIYFGASTDLRIYHDGTNSHIINSTGELRFTGSNFAFKSDSAKLYFGLSDDLQIYHDGSSSYIKDAGTGSLRILATDLHLRNSADSGYLAHFDDGGAVTLYHNGSAKFATTSTGIAITGLATMATGTASSKFAVGTASVHGSYDFYNDGTSYLNGAVTVDDVLNANNISILGTGILRVGTNQTWSVGVNPSSSIRLAYDGVERSITGHYTNGMSIQTNAHILRLATDGKVHFPAFTFPASDGTDGQVLQTDGSGNLTFVTGGGGAGDITAVVAGTNLTGGATSGSATINLATNLSGLGTISSGAIISSGNAVFGRTSIDPDSYTNYSGGFGLIQDGSGWGAYGLFVQGGGLGDAAAIAHNGSSLYFGIQNGSAANSMDTWMVVSPARAVDLTGSTSIALPNTTAGTISSGAITSASLHINSSTDQKILLSGSADPYIRWQEGSTNKAYMQWVAAGYILTKNEETTANFRLGNAFKLYPATDAGFIIERSGSPNVYQTIVNTSTTGTHSYLQLSTYNSSSAQNHGYLIKNAAQNGGNGLGNNSLYLWNQTNEVEIIPAGTIANRFTVETNGNVTIRGSAATIGGNTAWHAGNDGTGSGLDADLLDGFNTSTSATANTVVVREGSGHIYGNYILGSYFNASSGNSENPTIGQIWTQSTGDNYLRKSTPAHVRNQLGLWWTGNDGSGSGLDADLLDGLQASQFLRSDAANNNYSHIINLRAGGNHLGNHEFAASSTGTGYSVAAIELRESNYTGSGSATPPNLGFHWGGVVASNISMDSAGAITIRNNPGNAYENLRANNIYANGTNLVWHAGNDGSGSGLDADLLDGQHGSYYYAASNPSGYITSSGTASQSDMVTGSAFATTGSPSSVLEYQQASGQTDTKLAPSTDWHNSIRMGHGNPYSYYSSTIAVRMTGSGLGDLYTQNITNNSAQGWNKHWHNNNDGSGSGLDADLLDGNHASAFPFVGAVTNTWGTNGINYFRVERGGYSGSLVNGNMQVYTTGANSAFMSFHRSGYYAVNMGLDADNVLRIGGWSAAANRWILDMSGNMTAAGNVTAYSDIRLKENIEGIPNALEKVKQIRGVTFTRNDQEDKELRHTGVIAQEVEKVLPEVVSEDNLGVKNVAYGNMVGLLIEAIKELKQEVDDLKSKLENK